MFLAVLYPKLGRSLMETENSSMKPYSYIQILQTLLLSFLLFELTLELVTN